ncbi:MAG: hypothetical protein JXB32_23005 [Deltaproteobacteria bacterium]|nr:hypothetical protein [Deltaproteobacteria bacterium]
MSSTEILYGSAAADTIVYGDIVVYMSLFGCTGFWDIGPGICVFQVGSSETNYRGPFRFYDTWSSGSGEPLGIGGDPYEGPTWASDYIYPADLWSEPYIYCGPVGSIYVFVSMDQAFTPACGDGTADFPSDAEMEIRGDGGYVDASGADWIWGWNNDDVIMGDGGGDRLWGRSGADTINGDKGADQIFASNPGDTCTAGTEWLYGGFDDVATDWIQALDNTACQKRFYGGPGNDILRGSPNPDYMYGGDGADTMCGGGGVNYLYGGNGDDYLYNSTSSYCDGGAPAGGDPGDTCDHCSTSVSCESWGGSCPY